MYQSYEPQRRRLDAGIDAVQVGGHQSSGPSFLLLPGTESFLDYYGPLLARFGKRLITGLAIDLPGFGNPAPGGSLFDHGIDTIGLVIDQMVQEGAQSVLPVGPSFGGAILGAYLAARTHRLVAGAVLISPIGTRTRRDQDHTLENRASELLLPVPPGSRSDQDIAAQLEILKRVRGELNSRFRPEGFTDTRMLWMWPTSDWFLSGPTGNVEDLPTPNRWHHELLVASHIPTVNEFPFIDERLQAFRWELMRDHSWSVAR